MIHTIRHTLLLVLLGTLAACGSAAPVAQNPTAAAPTATQPTPAAAPTAAPTIVRVTATAPIAATLPAAVATAAPVPTAASGAIPEGLTPEGYHFLGRADAPATLVMYSDFL
jgi:hypothetical protein